MDLTQHIRNTFIHRFGAEPIIVRSPGRINLIGEHTDYNDGLVLPAAIDKAVYVAVKENPHNVMRLVSDEYKDVVEVPVANLAPSSAKPWTNYIVGVADQFQKRGFKVGGFDLVIAGDVPLGAGLSSSAAVECATAYALNEIFAYGLERLELVKLAQLAEHEFAGVKCGIMDQFASVFGKNDHLIKLDCRSLEYTYIPIDLTGYKLILFDSCVKHSLASSAYNTRREECESGLRMIQYYYPEVKSLRDATLEQVVECIKPVDQTVYKRCVYVVMEINRVELACEDLLRHDLASFGQRMFQTHAGLSCEYEVSCAELDFLVDQVKHFPSVIGARMMGGGFGGCTINLIAEDSVNQVTEAVTQSYQQKFAVAPRVYEVAPSAGTAVLV
ncbi:MAG: galactokinase [Cyclobacteriaceae bacterium]|nr:galactokinase [Cyclobacteriaceae bacterium]